MNIKFDEKTKKALEDIIKNSSENYIRIKVFRGCGRPAYEIYPSYKGEGDMLAEINDIPFVYKWILYKIGEKVYEENTIL